MGSPDCGLKKEDESGLNCDLRHSRKEGPGFHPSLGSPVGSHWLTDSCEGFLSPQSTLALILSLSFIRSQLNDDAAICVEISCFLSIKNFICVSQTEHLFSIYLLHMCNVSKSIPTVQLCHWKMSPHCVKMQFMICSCFHHLPEQTTHEFTVNRPWKSPFICGQRYLSLFPLFL